MSSKTKLYITHLSNETIEIKRIREEFKSEFKILVIKLEVNVDNARNRKKLMLSSNKFTALVSSQGQSDKLKSIYESGNESENESGNESYQSKNSHVFINDIRTESIVKEIRYFLSRIGYTITIYDTMNPTRIKKLSKQIISPHYHGQIEFIDPIPKRFMNAISLIKPYAADMMELVYIGVNTIFPTENSIQFVSKSDDNTRLKMRMNYFNKVIIAVSIGVKEKQKFYEISIKRSGYY